MIQGSEQSSGVLGRYGEKWLGVDLTIDLEQLRLEPPGRLSHQLSHPAERAICAAAVQAAATLNGVGDRTAKPS
jgi:hypothetical protein